MKRIIKKVLMNYLLIKDGIADVNSPVFEFRVIIDSAIKELLDAGMLSKSEEKFLDLIKQGLNINDISKSMNLSQTRTSILFHQIINKIYNQTGDLL